MNGIFRQGGAFFSVAGRLSIFTGSVGCRALHLLLAGAAESGAQVVG